MSITIVPTGYPILPGEPVLLTEAQVDRKTLIYKAIEAYNIAQMAELYGFSPDVTLEEAITIMKDTSAKALRQAYNLPPDASDDLVYAEVKKHLVDEFGILTPEETEVKEAEEDCSDSLEQEQYVRPERNLDQELNPFIFLLIPDLPEDITIGEYLEAKKAYEEKLPSLNEILSLPISASEDELCAAGDAVARVLNFEEKRPIWIGDM